jgi:hypothetical protein
LHVTVAVLVGCWALGRRSLWRNMASRLPAPLMGTGYALLLVLCVLLAPLSEKAFIYFQF